MTDIATAEANARAALARDPLECVAITAEEACALFDRVREIEAERDRAEFHAARAERVAADLRERKRDLDAANTALVEQLFTQATGRDIDAGFAASAQARAEWQARRAEAAEERIAGLLAALATERDRKRSWMHLTDRFFAERDKARAVADALASQNATLQATVLGLLAVVRPLDQAHIDVLRDMLDECERWMAHEEPISRYRAAALRAVLGVADV